MKEKEFERRLDKKIQDQWRIGSCPYPDGS